MAVEFDDNSSAKTLLDSTTKDLVTEVKRDSKAIWSLVAVFIIVAISVYIFLNIGKVNIPDSARPHNNGSELPTSFTQNEG
jgi:hypothetical protein